MLVNMKEMLNKAREEKYAVPQFNINNLEWTKYILQVGDSLRSPLILGVSEGAAKYMGGYKTVANMVNGLMSDLNITVPVALHLDHGTTVESCKKAIDAGFTSVMIDGSSHPLLENIRLTSEVVNYAKERNVSVEAELGHIGGTEDNIVADIAYAKLNDCIELVKATNVDFLAPALGSVHGIYKGEVRIDLDKMGEINNALNMPLVLHGGTGIPDDIIRNSIKNGVSKININTELQIAWSKGVREFLENDSKVYDPRKVIGSGEKNLKEVVNNKIMLLMSNDRHL